MKKTKQNQKNTWREKAHEVKRDGTSQDVPGLMQKWDQTAKQ